MKDGNTPTKFSIDELLKNSDFGEMEKEQFDEIFSLKNIDVSARVLHHWSECDLLIEKERGKDMNHKFSFFELIWLKIIQELRSVGFPLSRIKMVKEFIIKKRTFLEFFNWKTDEDIVEGFYHFHRDLNPDKKLLRELVLRPDVIQKIKTKKVSVLQFVISRFLEERNIIKLLVTKDGVALPFTEGEMHSVVAGFLEKETCITIPIYKLVLSFLDDENNFDLIPRSGILNFNENKIIELIRSGKYTDITITFRDRQPVFVEARKNVNVFKEARLSEILLERKYQQITIGTVNGNIAFANSTEKIKLE